MVTRSGDAKIVDFGLARRVRPLDGTTGTQTVASGDSTSGTPAYMAPETLRGAPADKRSDIWALGVLLHEMVTGALPFDGRTMADMTSAILRDAPRPLPELVPQGLAGIIRRCLAKEPAERYQAAGEVRSALETIATGQQERADGCRGAAPAAPRLADCRRRSSRGVCGRTRWLLVLLAR